MKTQAAFLGLSFFVWCGPAHAVVFDAYKDTLEKAAVCAAYPKLDLSMHVQMLKETGAIPANSALGATNKIYTFKATKGFMLYGFPFLAVAMSPGDKNIGPSVAVTVQASGAELGRAALENARKFVGGVAFKQGFPKHFTLATTDTDPTDYEVTISEDKPGQATLLCGPFVP